LGVDIKINWSYTIIMETMITLPDGTLYAAEEAVCYRGVPRSESFAMALDGFESPYNGEMITEKINEVYEKIDQTEFEPYLTVGLEPLRSITKNDAW
jgi:hypothetical protein